MVKINQQLLLRHAAIEPTGPISINPESDAATAHALLARNNQLERENRLIAEQARRRHIEDEEKEALRRENENLKRQQLPEILRRELTIQAV